jgi:hypothetical protein
MENTDLFLSLISARMLFEVQNALPPPGLAVAETLVREATTIAAGRILVTFRCQQFRRHRTTWHEWVPDSAMPVRE